MIHQTPWFERKFDFNFPVGLFPVIMVRLEGASPRMIEMIKNKSDEVLSRKQNNDWSVKEQIGHLYDLEELWYGRVEDFLSGTATLRAADLRNAKTHEAGHNSRKISDLVNQFSEARNKLIAMIEDIDETTALIPDIQCADFFYSQ